MLDHHMTGKPQAESQNNYLSKREVYTKVSTSRSKIQRVVSLKITTSQRERFIKLTHSSVEEMYQGLKITTSQRERFISQKVELLQEGESLKITTSQRERFICFLIAISTPSVSSQNNYLSKREVY